MQEKCDWKQLINRRRGRLCVLRKWQVDDLAPAAVSMPLWCMRGRKIIVTLLYYALFLGRAERRPPIVNATSTCSPDTHTHTHTVIKTHRTKHYKRTLPWRRVVTHASTLERTHARTQTKRISLARGRERESKGWLVTAAA